MKLVKKILDKLNGLYYPQEYLCLTRESFEQSLHVYLADDGKIIKDITNEHLFIGYCPLIIALYPVAGNSEAFSDNIDIIFSQQVLPLNESFEKKDAIARLSLQLTRKQSTGDTTLYFYEGIKGEHRFINSFHQYIIGLHNRLFNKKPGNIFLHDNLYKQVQIAYSVPRIISLITVRDGSLFNLFPTDLHGPVSEEYYVSSLRHEGKACKQVEAARRIVISTIHHDVYKTVYALGKNHVRELKSKGSFPFGNLLSNQFLLPLPKHVLYYRELELIETFDRGIHRLLLYKVISGQAVSDEPATLAHIHNAYATWRHNKGLSGNYLLR